MKKYLVCIGFLVIAACSRADKSATQKQSATPVSKTDPLEFVYNGKAEPDSLDPHRTWAHDSALIIHQMFEGLLTREPDFVTVKPGLASEWNVSEDGKTYRFKLRPGIKWSTGEAITADQVLKSLHRAMDPKVANPYIKWYTDFIVGAEDFHKNYTGAKRAEAEKNLGIQLAGGDTVEFKLIKPISYFKYFIAQPTFYIVHPSMYDATSSAWTDPAKFITNSAYKLKEWKVNDRIILEKNKEFYDAANTKLERIVIIPVGDESASYNLYQSGSLDWTNDNAISTTLVPSLKGREDFHINPTIGTYSIIFNVKKKPFDDARVRRALAMTIDQPMITDRVLRSGFQPAYKLIPPVIPNYQTLVPEPKPLEERIAEAKKLLAEAGFPDGKGFPKVTYRYNTDEAHHKIAQTLQQTWQKNLGVQIQLENLEWKVFLTEQKTGNFEISRLGWIGDYPDPATFLELYMTGNENNRSFWSNQEYDSLVNQALEVQDEAKRYELYAKAEKIVMDESPMGAIYHYSYFSLMHPRVQGFKPNPHGHYHFRYFSKK